MVRAVYLTTFLFCFSACVSSESPKLKESRVLQDDTHKRTAVADSLLNENIAQLRLERDRISTDTLLASDSLLRMHYASVKEHVDQLEQTQLQLHNWRDNLIALPPQEEIARGVANPFGANAGDTETFAILNTYSDSLTIIENLILTLIQAKTYERTSTPQP